VISGLDPILRFFLYFLFRAVILSTSSSILSSGKMHFGEIVSGEGNSGKSVLGKIHSGSASKLLKIGWQTVEKKQVCLHPL
ncbi:hypothetical protein L9F63_002344, partial [Diploptera punctata]